MHDSKRQITSNLGHHPNRCIVIGAGIGGLASACLLASKGCEVQVLEKNETPGGKMQQVRASGFRFDTGPSLMTMPEILGRVFEAAGEDIENHLELSEPIPVCRYVYSDGTRFDSFTDRESAAAEVGRIAPEDREAYLTFLDDIESLYEKTAGAFLFNPLFGLRDLKALRWKDALSIDAFTTVSRRIDNTFKSSYMRMFFKRFTTYNGSDPYQAPGTLNVIPHVELNLGGYYVKGGLYAVANALHKLAVSLGVKFRFGAEVAALEMADSNKKRLARARLADGSIVDADWFFSNSDATETLTKLLPEDAVPAWKRTLQDRLEPSCSGFVLLLGCDHSWDQLCHHNIFFPNNYQKEFDDIFREKQLPSDPTIYIANTSYSDPSDAPTGGSNLFILVNAPYLSGGQDWKQAAAVYTDNILNTLEQRGLEGLRGSVRFKKVITPADLYEATRSNRGSIYGTSSNGRFSAFLRPRNRVRSLDNLFLTGGSTHPGGGIPLVVQSALHAVELFDRSLKG